MFPAIEEQIGLMAQRDIKDAILSEIADKQCEVVVENIVNMVRSIGGTIKEGKVKVCIFST